MKTVLYIHGLNSSGESRTAKFLKQFLEPSGVKVISPTLPHDNPEKTFAIIKTLIAKEGVNIVIGSSLGGFFTMKCRNVFKIVMNPCMHPVTELPKLGVNGLVVEKYKTLEKTLLNDWDNEERGSTTGIFGTNDELFSYKSEFISKKLGKCITTSDQHRISSATIKNVVVPIILNFFENINESHDIRLNEHYVTALNKTEMSEYKYEVWNILTKSYEKIGGLKGCDTPEQLIADTDIWKMVRRNGKIVAVICYSTKRGGRKVIAMGTDGTPQGKSDLYKIISEDITRKERNMWAELSDVPQYIYTKLGANPIPAEVVKMLLPDKKILKIQPDGYHYIRLIGGEPHEKICFGTV